MAAGVAAAETDAEARFLRSSQILAFANLRMGRPGPLPRKKRCGYIDGSMLRASSARRRERSSMN